MLIGYSIRKSFKMAPWTLNSWCRYEREFVMDISKRVIDPKMKQSVFNELWSCCGSINVHWRLISHDNRAWSDVLFQESMCQVFLSMVCIIIRRKTSFPTDISYHPFELVTLANWFEDLCSYFSFIKLCHVIKHKPVLYPGPVKVC